jgi:plastocyanin
MKTRILCLLSLLFAISQMGYTKTYTIVNSGFTFSPSTLTVNVGDTVIFSLESIHNARQVDLATWNADGSTSNGGFDTPDGGGTVVLNQAGTIYYVCKYHVALYGMKGTITVNAATAVSYVNSTIPKNYLLLQNYPNPFNPTTIISYALPYESKVSVKVYDVSGKQITELADNTESAGYHNLNFNADNLASGIYFYRIEAVSIDGTRKFDGTKKMILLK